MSDRNAAAPVAVDLAVLRERMREFAREREWERFHTPRNLAAALSVEAAELLEHFQWLSDEESANLTPERRDAVSLEMADVLLYLVRLADRLDVDLLATAARKIELNAAKYPVEKSKGSARKYTEL